MDYKILWKVGESSKVPIYVYQNAEKLFQWPDQQKYQSPFDLEKEVLLQIEQAMQERKKPFLFVEDSRIFYGAMAVEDRSILFGPVCPEMKDQALLADYRRRHHFSRNPYLPRISAHRLSLVMSLLLWLYNKEDVECDQIPIVNIVPSVSFWDIESAEEHYGLEQSEEERDHNSGEYERMLLRVVRSGDVNAMQRILNGADLIGTEHIGILARSRAKQIEYMCVAMLTLLPRAAVEGGMPREEAFSLSDLFMQKLEKCRTQEEMLALTGRAQYEFTDKVRKSRRNRAQDSVVEAAKAYVSSNLRKPFQIGEIAPAIGVSRSHLTRKFTEEEGISLQGYVTRERCRHAANLLKHSDYSISLIAEYFCFSSQSHFGKAFKEYCGMTPKDYRNRHKES